MTSQKDKKSNIAVFASGTGSNAVKLYEESLKSDYYTIKCLITDKENAPVINKFKKFNIPVFIAVLDKTLDKSKRREDQENRILKFLDEMEIEWCFLAGYMRVLSKNFIDHFKTDGFSFSKIINIHPSLLPRHPGKNAYERAFEDDYPDSGITVHFVDYGVDTGPIILQEKLEKIKSEPFENFKKRGLILEHQVYPLAINKVFKDFL